MHRRVVFILVALVTLVVAPAITFAQPPGKPVGQTPTPITEGPVIALPSTTADETNATTAPRLDLAAMTLDSTTVPAGYQLFYEIYIPGNRISNDLTGGLISQAEFDRVQLEWYYESVYVSADGNTRLRSYVEQYADDEGAISGFDLLENDALFLPEGAIFEDLPGPGVGQEPSEISQGSLQPSGNPMIITSIDATFRVDNLLAGVSVDTTPGITANKQLAIDLSQVLYDRIQAVRTAQPLPLIDYSLPDRVVSLGPAWNGHDEGYLSATEILGATIDPAIANSFVSGYFTNESPAGIESSFPVPLVSLTIAEFQDETAPLQIINRPEMITPPFPGATAIQIAPIPGASSTLAFEYVNPLLSTESDDADSVRLVVIAGGSLVILDIQANRTLDGARDAALQIAAAQVSCLQATTSCAPLQLPAGLLEPPLPSDTPPTGPVG